jgi:hypothetical protein
MEKPHSVLKQNTHSSIQESIELKQETRKLIDHLYSLVDQKDSAIKRLQKELFQIHAENKQLTLTIEKLEQQLARHQKTTNELLSSEIESLSIQELKNRYIQLSTKLSQSLSQLSQNHQSLAHLDSIKAQVYRFNQNEKLTLKLSKIEKAHMAQQVLVLELQEQVSKSQHLKQIIKKQELVIDKLERGSLFDRGSSQRLSVASSTTNSVASSTTNPVDATLLIRAETAEQRVLILEKQVLLVHVAD